MSVGWRAARSTTGYFHSRVNRNFNNLWQPKERLSIMDVSARYIFSPRFSLEASLPIVFNQWSQLFPILGSPLGRRANLNANGLGDLSLYANTWLLKRKQHPLHNFALGIGIKVPTGNWFTKDTYPNLQGTISSNRTVFPPAIMPGDGGTGLLVGFNAYKILAHPDRFRGTTFFADGLYLVNPRDTNGAPSVVALSQVPIPAQLQNRLVNSVPDTWTATVGVSMPLPNTIENERLRGLRVNLTGRGEGISEHDLIGRSNGFRQPGYALAVGPGFSYAYKHSLWTVEVPIIFARTIIPTPNLVPGLPTIVNGRPTANFSPTRNMGLVAPVALLVRYTRTF
ncbi:MAG: hypothetical protein C5B53_00495 [Candidatus Melainabacteria bacterium]|nr:MAG: hypothetical protein C5B53_00495 [Candidatus Melainabacteria bacterium]